MIDHFLATMSDQQAMDSIRQTLGQRVDTTMMAWAAIATAVVVGAIVYFNQRMRRNSQSLNNMGKLVKEISQEVGLKPAEIKKLRELAGLMNEPVRKNPLVLLLCPSILSKAMKKQ
jgi:ABC-type transport system involved in Fe-S cluster assembly fused permease/ATPase subunit